MDRWSARACGKLRSYSSSQVLSKYRICSINGLTVNAGGKFPISLVIELLNLLDAAIFNHLIGNIDAHGKNFLLLYPDKEVRLAPLYDLISTTYYPELYNDMAIGIGHVQLDIIRQGFFKRGLCGQTDAAQHDSEARIRTQAIKQQVRLEAQSKI
jgi:hypothetical protein